ncbi:hypothetical protein [Effusibacillus pohliae]|uniref:hypothetical protein n=1 Tax=Effusibacillus pohliae TaxID=232270 RepID=UPI0003682923|nr:hypothetical protein [Effusibacillus pohliae]
MQWIYWIAQMLIPVGVAIYTINFGRWMAAKRLRMGAYGAYGLAVIALAVTILALLRHTI